MLKGIVMLGAGCACAGVIATGFLPQLPPLSWLCGSLVIVVVPLWWLRRRPWRIPLLALAGALLGAIWGCWSGNVMLSRQLPFALEGQVFKVVGTVVDLPHTEPLKQRFLLAVEHLDPIDPASPPLPSLPGRVLLNWYGGQSVVPGERWQWVVKLKRPRGFVNPGGFDYQAWLLRQGVGATGYVRKSHFNGRLASSKGTSVDYWRLELAAWLRRVLPESSMQGILTALVVGDRSGITPSQWSLLQRTGTNHLIAISGLHVGLTALLGQWLGMGLGRVLNLGIHRLDSTSSAALFSLASASCYAALAGFSLPTQRALIMVAAVQLCALSGRAWQPLQGLLVALVLVLIADPLAGHDLGFWLSFGAVGWLLYGFSGRSISGGWISGLLRAQWLVFAGLMIPSLLLVTAISPVSPITNLVAIPLVSFGLVPLLLLAAVGYFGAGESAAVVLVGADMLARVLWHWLEAMDSVSGQGGWYPSAPLTGARAAMGLAAVLLLLMPRGVPGRWLGALGLSAVLFPVQVARAPLMLTVLDVGQGLAVVVETPEHTLVYDTGPVYSQRFDAGAGVVAPYLKRRGIKTVDAVVVSHGDSDHAGGLEGLLGNLPAKRLYFGEPLRGSGVDGRNSFGSHQHINCESGHRWQWRTVSFELLAADSGFVKSNNRSCILAIRFGQALILLPGDIERKVEQSLLQRGQLPAEVTVLVAPHHGSASSSSPAFVAHTRPQYVLYSAGYGNRYRHPNRTVLQRYQHQESRAFNTAYAGAIQFIWRDSNQPEVVIWRERQKRYWFTEDGRANL